MKIKIEQRHEPELIQYKQIFTYKRLEECEKFFSKYISECKKDISQLRKYAHERVEAFRDDNGDEIPKERKGLYEQEIVNSLRPKLTLSYNSATQANNIISCVRKIEQTELESVVNALKEIKKIAKNHDETVPRSRLNNYFKKTFEKFNILHNGEKELAKIERFITYEKEKLVYQRLPLTP